MIDFGLSKDYSESKVMQSPGGSVTYIDNYIIIALLYSSRSSIVKL
jgi:hypothetical protein